MVVAHRAALPVVQPVAVVWAETSLVLEVVALAAVDLVLVVPLVLQVIVPAVHLVPQMTLVLEVVVAAMLHMPLVFQVVVAPVLQMPVMLQVAVMLEVPLVLEVVVTPVVMPHMVPMVDAVPVMAAVPPVMPTPQRRADLGASRGGQPVPAMVVMPPRMPVVGPGHGDRPLLARVRREHLQRIRTQRIRVVATSPVNRVQLLHRHARGHVLARLHQIRRHCAVPAGVGDLDRRARRHERAQREPAVAGVRLVLDGVDRDRLLPGERPEQVDRRMLPVHISGYRGGCSRTQKCRVSSVLPRDCAREKPNCEVGSRGT